MNNNSLEIKLGVTLGVIVGIIGFTAEGVDELWTRYTTKSIKDYHIQINKIDTVRTGSIQSYRLHVKGDTTGIIEDYPCHKLEIGKEYNCSIRRYGLLFENERIEKIKEIKK